MSDIRNRIGLEEEWVKHSDGKVYRRWRFIGGPEAWSEWELTAHENIPYLVMEKLRDRRAPSGKEKSE